MLCGVLPFSFCLYFECVWIMCGHQTNMAPFNDYSVSVSLSVCLSLSVSLTEHVPCVCCMVLCVVLWCQCHPAYCLTPPLILDTYTNTYSDVHTYVYSCRHTCMYGHNYVSAHTVKYAHIHASARTHTHTHAHTHTRTHARTHKHTEAEIKCSWA